MAGELDAYDAEVLTRLRRLSGHGLPALEAPPPGDA
jgi:hypothetical protein